MIQLQQKLKYGMITILFLIGCQEKKQLGDMHRSTGEMNGTTKGMNNTMTEMNNTMKNMSVTMDNMNRTFFKVSGVMEHMDGSLSETNGDIRMMNGTLQTVDGRIGNMDRTLVNVDGKFSNLQNTINKVDSKIGEMNDTLGSLHTEIVDMNDLLKDVNNSMSELVLKIDAMDGKMGNLLEQITGMNRVISALGFDIKSMSGKLDGMSDKMGDLLGKMVEIFEIARPGMSMMLRQNSWSQLKEAEEFPGKVAEAAKYFMSFEYQVYLPTNEEEIHKRDELAASAANEFLLQVKDLLPGGKPNLDSFNFMSLTNSNVEALSVAMHRVNEVQMDYVKKYNAALRKEKGIQTGDPIETALKDQELQTISMYSLITESLIHQKSNSSSSENLNLKAYEKIILENRDLAVWLLKVRGNMLIKMIIDMLPTKVNISAQTPLMKGLQKAVSAEKMNSFVEGISPLKHAAPRDILFDKMSPEVTEKVMTLIKATLLTQKTLDDIGADSSILPLVKTSLLGINLKESTAGLNELQIKLDYLFKLLIKQIVTSSQNSKLPLKEKQVDKSEAQTTKVDGGPSSGTPKSVPAGATNIPLVKITKPSASTAAHSPPPRPVNSSSSTPNIGRGDPKSETAAAPIQPQ